MNNTVLDVENLMLSINSFNLGPINFRLYEDKIYALVGKTGSGKSSLIEAISGLYEDKVKGNIKIHEDTSFVFQELYLFPYMTVKDNIIYPLKNKKKSKDFIKNKLLYVSEVFQISNILNKYPESLSGGEKKRCALARAFITEPKFIILDEAFNGLDMVTKKSILKNIMEYKEKNKATLFVITHNYEEINLSDEISVMAKGSMTDFICKDKLEYEALRKLLEE